MEALLVTSEYTCVINLERHGAPLQTVARIRVSGMSKTRKPSLPNEYLNSMSNGIHQTRQGRTISSRLVPRAVSFIGTEQHVLSTGFGGPPKKGPNSPPKSMPGT